MTRRFLLLLALGGGALSAFSAERARLNERIAVSATAAPDYQRVNASPAEVKPESYVFYQGHHFASGTRDTGLERTTFDQLTRILAPDLARQKYFPTRNAAAADLVIVVHWGASQIFEDPQRNTMIETLNKELLDAKDKAAETGMYDPGVLNHISDSLTWGQDNAQSALTRNAAILGYARGLKLMDDVTGVTTEEAKVLRAELSEERYFVVLMAYDNKALKTEKSARPRWITRLSVRTPGNNFVEALPVLSQVGSHVFGRQIDNLVHLRANLPEGKVSLGELKILGIVEEPSATEKPR